MFRARQYVVFFFLAAIFASLLIRLFFLQVLDFNKFSSLAAAQHNRVLKIEPRRGTIYDRFMEPMAVNLDVPSVYCDPRKVKDAEYTANILAKMLDVDQGRLLKKLKKDKAFIWVKRKISGTLAEEISDLKLDGVHFVDESQRNYSNDAMAAHIIGFVGLDNQGLEGLELLYDEELKGREGWRHLVRDAKRQTVLYDESESIPPQNGYNLILTVDSVIQYIVEEELEKIARQFNVKSASAVVMEPSSGRVLALANYPAYDLNSFFDAPKEVMKNAAISNIFEPGSVFKIVAASAALEEGVVSLETPVYCEKGEYKVGGRVLHDFHRYGDLSFLEVISKSSNIGTVKIAKKLGKIKIHEYIKKFGFGGKTGIDMPGEVAGITRNHSRWSRSDITTIPIGQGIAVTALQLARAISVIANGGYLVKPFIVDRITTVDGEIYKEFSPEGKNRILSKKTCQKMREVLRDVVTHGTGRRANSKVYDLCGKTGTAQMVNPKGGYYSDKYNATFIGFAPYSDPVISIAVVARDPHPVHFGGSVAGPAFKGIAEGALQYLERNNK